MKINKTSFNYHSNYTEITNYLYSLLPPDQVERVFSYRYCDIDPEFLGFVDTYYYLSKLIPKHYTVIDFGCAYNPQCFFFSEHKKYIAVEFNAGVDKCFYTPNCELVASSIQDYISNMNFDDWDMKTTFAICNYVPNNKATKLVSDTFQNCYCFYPAGSYKEETLCLNNLMQQF